MGIIFLVTTVMHTYTDTPIPPCYEFKSEISKVAQALSAQFFISPNFAF